MIRFFCVCRIGGYNMRAIRLQDDILLIYLIWHNLHLLKQKCFLNYDNCTPDWMALTPASIKWTSDSTALTPASTAWKADLLHAWIVWMRRRMLSGLSQTRHLLRSRKSGVKWILLGKHLVHSLKNNFECNYLKLHNFFCGVFYCIQNRVGSSLWGWGNFLKILYMKYVSNITIIHILTNIIFNIYFWYNFYHAKILWYFAKYPYIWYRVEDTRKFRILYY